MTDMVGTAFRMAGLLALCLEVGVVLSGAVGAQPQPAPIVTVNLIATPVEGPAPLTVVFSAMGQPPSDRACPSATYSFDFGDGTGRTSISPIAVHTYTKPGTYQALVVYTAHFLVGTAPPCVPRQAVSRPVVIQVLQPLPETWPCILTPDNAAFAPIADQLAKKLPLPIDPPPDWPELYASQHFKTYINPEYKWLPPLPPEVWVRLQQGAFIGGMKALVKFEIIDRGQCFGRNARSFDDGTYLAWMAHGGVLLGAGPRNGIPTTGAGGKTIEIKWCMALVRPSPDGKTTIEALIFYPDDKDRSPEEMLKAARSYDDGGILLAKPPY